MIATSPLTANISQIDLTAETYQTIINGIKETPFTEGEKYGFVPEHIGRERASAYLVVRTPTKVREFNPQTESVEERTTDQTDLIPFRIDAHLQLLEVFSNKDDVREVELRLGQVGDWDFSVTDTRLDLSRIHQRLRDEADDIRVKSLKIKDFSVSESTKGTYHPKIFEQEEATRLFREYDDGVIYFSAEFKLGQEEITVGFYETGSVQIYNNTNQTEELLELVKQAIMKEEIHA